MNAETPDQTPDILALRFEGHRARLEGLARRMLGSAAEAQDAVQEAWLRLSRSDARGIDNFGGWLTTVVSRLCLDALRARRPEDAWSDEGPEARLASADDAQETLFLADAVGPALMIVLDRLPPAERVALVLHDLFAVPFEEVAGILGRSPEAARQLASRARRRVRGGDDDSVEATRTRRQGLVDAFLKASREGDFEALLAVLSPDAALRADALAVHTAAANAAHGAPALAPEVRGARGVAEAFKGRAAGALRARLDGVPGAVWAPGGTVRVAFVFAYEGERIGGIEMVMDPERVAAMEIEILG